MRIFGHRVIVLLGMMWLLAGCEKLTSPQPSPRGEGVASLMLRNIDSLMWQIWGKDTGFIEKNSTFAVNNNLKSPYYEYSDIDKPT